MAEDLIGQLASISDNDLPLAARLREAIRTNGPMTFRDWMQAALYDEREGYYNRIDLARWGRSGDYRTSPERSPLFAATFAGYFAKLFEELGSPNDFVLYEVGAGAGHFALGVLETLARKHKRVYDSTRYVIAERSSASRHQTAALIKQSGQQHHRRVEFAPCGTVEIENGIIFANELLDALAVHRVRVIKGFLCEQFVDVNRIGEFVFIDREPSTPRLEENLRRFGATLCEGQSAEVNLDAEEWVKTVAAMLKRGFVIAVDYGAEAQELYDPAIRPHGTLRSFRRHELCENVLARPGDQDITSHVNWTQLMLAGDDANLKLKEFKRQDQFLLGAGILDELESLTSSNAGVANIVSLRLDVRELIMPELMSASFQVLVLEKP
ncbi:MAG: SAM-dependent methyltransferase [Pyrinomonadaceae bacterium]